MVVCRASLSQTMPLMTWASPLSPSQRAPSLLFARLLSSVSPQLIRRRRSHAMPGNRLTSRCIHTVRRIDPAVELHIEGNLIDGRGIGELAVLRGSTHAHIHCGEQLHVPHTVASDPRMPLSQFSRSSIKDASRGSSKAEVVVAAGGSSGALDEQARTLITQALLAHQESGTQQPVLSPSPLLELIGDGTEAATMERRSGAATPFGSGAPTPRSDSPTLAPRNKQAAHRTPAAAGKHTNMTILEFNVSGHVHRHVISRQDLFGLVRKEVSRRSSKVASSVAPKMTTRDLRKLDFSIIARAEPSLLVREHVLFLIVDPMRAVILRDRCLIVFATEDPLFLDAIERKLGHLVSNIATDRIAFEFEALEFIMSMSMEQLNHEVEQMGRLVGSSLAKLQGRGVTTAELEELRSLKNDVNLLESRVRGMNDAVTHVLEKDEDMFLMQLTRLWSDPALLEAGDFEDHDDAEIMLEAVVLMVSRTARVIKRLLSDIAGSEQSMQQQLKHASNKLLTADLIQTLLLLCLNLVATISAFFGLALCWRRHGCHAVQA